jgi:hypothetical protein
MAECIKTKWKSKVTTGAGDETARFEIDTEDAGGNFYGTFQVDSGDEETIMGNCSAERIWFNRPKDSPQYRYEGLFLYESGKKKYIQGTRTLIAITKAEADDKLKKNETLLPPPDDWVSETTT